MTLHDILRQDVRDNIEIDGVVFGIVTALRKHFSKGWNIDQESEFYCDVAKIMARIGLLSVDSSQPGFKAYTWTRDASELYEGLVREGIYKHGSKG